MRSRENKTNIEPTLIVSVNVEMYIYDVNYKAEIALRNMHKLSLLLYEHSQKTYKI
jgi:hypothetical protein